MQMIINVVSPLNSESSARVPETFAKLHPYVEGPPCFGHQDQSTVSQFYL